LLDAQGSALPQAVISWPLNTGGPCSIRGQSMWDLWWKRGRWGRFLSEYLYCSPSVSFHHCVPQFRRLKV